MRSQKLDANKDPMDPLGQVAILGNHPYLLRSFLFFFNEILFHNGD